MKVGVADGFHEAVQVGCGNLMGAFLSYERFDAINSLIEGYSG